MSHSSQAAVPSANDNSGIVVADADAADRTTRHQTRAGVLPWLLQRLLEAHLYLKRQLDSASSIVNEALLSLNYFVN
jgi:hypothetical protein